MPDRGALDVQIAVAQTESATALAQLMRVGGDGALIADVKAQLANLASLKRQLETATRGALPALQAEIAACAAASSSFAKEASSARGDSGKHVMDEAEARAAARKAITEVNQALFKDRILDPYLQFASKEDEDAYRKREAERQAAIEKELAKGTAQGELNALGIQKEQWRDAGAHGARKSPDYERMGASIEENSALLGTALDARKPKAQEQVTVDPLADIVSNADVAKFQRTGTVIADQKATGHGVNIALLGQRSPDLPG